MQIQTTNSPPNSPFTDFEGLAARVPYSPRSLRALYKKGVIPSIRLPHSRKLIFHVGDVDAALRRHSKGGQS